MNRSLCAAFSLLATCLAGCIPFVLESESPHFAASEYSFPVADGVYVLEGHPRMSAKFATMADHVAILMTEEGGGTSTLIGGFIALATPGHFIFQATNGAENGKPVDKKPGETTYLPMRISDSGEVNWFPGPDRSAPDIVRLLQVHGFEPGHNGRWTPPKGLSRAQLTAFYEDLAPLLDRSGWTGMKMQRIAGS